MNLRAILTLAHSISLTAAQRQGDGATNPIMQLTRHDCDQASFVC